MGKKHVRKSIITLTIFIVVGGLLSGCGSGTGNVTGQVTDASSGSILTGANVTSGGQITATDNYGNYTLNNVPIGNGNVTVWYPPSYDDNSAQITVSQNQQVTQNLTLSKITAKGAVEGLVVDASTGLPVSGAVVSTESQGTMTDEGGKFRLQGVPEGAQTITVKIAGFEDASDDVTVGNEQAVTKKFLLRASRE